MKIRQATLDDIEQLAQLVTDFCIEADLPYNPEAVAFLLIESITTAHHYCYVAEEQDELVACFLGFLDRDVFNHFTFGQDRLMYVKPKYRDKTYSHRLYLHFLTWAEQQHCKYVSLNALCSKDNEQLAKVLEHLQCSRKGVMMIRYL